MRWHRAGKMTKTNKLGFIGGFQIPNREWTRQTPSRSAPQSVTGEFQNRDARDLRQHVVRSGKRSGVNHALADQGVDVITMIARLTYYRGSNRRAAWYVLGWAPFDGRAEICAQGMDQRHRLHLGGFLTREIQAIEKGTWKSNPEESARRPQQRYGHAGAVGARSPIRREDDGRGKDHRL